jgi:hypothetical protein
MEIFKCTLSKVEVLHNLYRYYMKIQGAVDQVRGHLRAKFKIPYSYGHLVSISEQCDASIMH